jgi:hypothetical protein
MYLTHRQDDNVLVMHGSKDGTQKTAAGHSSRNSF